MKKAKQITEQITSILEENYEDSSNSGIRDILTDLVHLCDEKGIDINERLYAAQDVAEEELDNE